MDQQTVTSDVFRLIDEIYAAGLQAGNWPVALQKFAHLSGDCAVALHAWDATGASCPGNITINYPDEAVKAYLEHYARINYLWPIASARPTGVAFCSEDIAPLAEFEGHPFLEEWLRPNGLEVACGINLVAEEQRHAALTISYPEALHPQRTGQVMELLRLTASHLQRAVEMNRALDQVESAQQRFQILLDQRRHPTLIVDMDLQVKGTSQSARECLADGSIIQQTDQGALLLHAASVPLKRNVRALIANPKDESNAQVLPVNLGGCKGLVILSLMEPHVAVVPVLPSHGEPRVMITLLDLCGGSEAGISYLSGLFGLTETESRLLGSLLRGEELAAYASRRGVSKNTARNQLQSIFMKTETSRQAELVALTARLAGHLGAN